MAELDWNAVQAIGTTAAAVIAVLAYALAKRAADAERARNEKQAEVDARQGENITLLAESVRKMADSQEGQLLALTNRVTEIEAARDPASSERRRREQAAAEAEARAHLRELDSRLDTIILPHRDAFAGSTPGVADPKRVIRFTSNPRARVKKCEECGAALKGTAANCPDCGHAVPQ